MTSHRIEAIVLASTKTGERSLVVHCLSDTFGRRGFLCSVSKSSSMALFLPLNIINAEVLENPRSDLWRIRNITSEYPLSGIRESLAKNSICLFMSEVLYRVLREGAVEYGLSIGPGSRCSLWMHWRATIATTTCVSSWSLLPLSVLLPP